MTLKPRTDESPAKSKATAQKKKRTKAKSNRPQGRPHIALSDVRILERVIFRQHTFLPVDNWRSLMERRQSAVCQIHIRGTPETFATGFLVGPDVVMTNNHVVKDVSTGEYKNVYSSADVRVAFDVRDGRVTARADTFGLAKKWAMHKDEKLDFALLQLDRKPSPVRPWIKPVRHQFEMSEPLIIIQHPHGSGLKVAFGPFRQLQGEKEVAYMINTEPGSSGSPCFTTDWQLVAFAPRLRAHRTP
jgi:hypothetical protein